jgi:L-threonylcarbamoyladenylate synthase
MSVPIFSPSSENIQLAVSALRRGELVGVPTETVYGLAGRATSDAAVANIFAVKGRPDFNPLICHVTGAEMASRYVVWNSLAEQLAERFWPGPLTMILPRRPDCSVSLLASAGIDSLAVRSANHEVINNVIQLLDEGLCAPSANRSGRISPTTAQHVSDEFSEGGSMVLDGGACMVGIESTVIHLCTDTPLILRAGSITSEELSEFLGTHVGYGGDSKILSPGQLASHYAPSIPVRLNVMDPQPNEALLSFGNKIPVGAKTVLHLSKRGDLTEAAANLFAMMRALDSNTHSAIAVMPIPSVGIGVAINDRLKRAATR